VPNGKTPSNAVDTVVATGKNSGWAFLASGSVAYERTGSTAWKKVAFPGRGGAVSIASATSPGNVWAAYHTASATQVDRWNGRKWAVVKSFPGRVTGLSVLGPNDVWVFGKTVYHFNGHKWAEVASGFQGGTAINDRDVWAYSGTKVVHYDGRKWTQVNVAKLFPPKTPAETTSPVVTGIVALAANNVYAIGEGPLGAHIANGVVLHYNGRSWSRAATGPFISRTGQQATADGRGGLWFSAGNVEGPTLLLHYLAGKVSIVYLPGGGTLPTGSNSVSRIPGTAEVLAGGLIYNATNPAASHSVVFQYS
jgi:hypothetical protein